MALNRITGLGMILLGSSMIYAGCDSGGSTVQPGGGGNSQGGAGGSSGASTGGGGVSNTGGSSAAHTGGAIGSNTGGAGNPTGGAGNTGGSSTTGTCTSCPLVTAGSSDCATASTATGSFTIKNSNYFQLGNYAGYGFVYISPTTNSADSITCANATFGASTTSLCGAATVPADPCYNAVGGVGFNLSQATSGGKDSNKAITTTVNNVTITFANTGATKLHIQIVKNAAGTDAGGTNYCIDASGKNSPITVDANVFTTKCWDSANPGDPWDGTGAQSVQMIVPSDATATTPFDVCLENIVFG